MLSVTTLRNYQEIPEVDHVTIWEAEHYEVPHTHKEKNNNIEMLGGKNKVRVYQFLCRTHRLL